MPTKPKPAILPRDLRDPTGVDALERRAMRDFSMRIRKAVKIYKAVLGQIPAEPVVNAKYAYRLVPTIFWSLLAQADLEMESIFLDGGEEGLWFTKAYVEVAAARGAAQAFANLAQQSPAYSAGRQSLQQLLASEPYQRRLTLIRMREFEEMSKLKEAVKADMSRLLADGIGRGLNPREVARNLTEQAGIEEFRAHRIARTEITTALRRARWDETQDAEDAFGLVTKEMHLSALSPTTRTSHAARHGKFFTVDECRDWWAEGANSINCKCATTSVMVDKDGKPLVPSIVDRAMKAKENMEARGYAWAED